VTALTAQSLPTSVSASTTPLIETLSAEFAAASGSKTAQTTPRSTEGEYDRDVTKPPSTESAGTSGSQTSTSTDVAAMGAKALISTSMTQPLFLIEGQGMRLQSPAPNFVNTPN